MPEMPKKGETKRQHYVPQFVLRNFSEDERNIGVFVLGSGQVVARGPIKTQAYEDYFYGADQILEKTFAEGEADVSSRLGDLSTDRLNGLSGEDLLQVAFFVHYQHFRTKASVEQANNMATAMSQWVLREMAAKNGDSLAEEHVQGLRASYNDGPMAALTMATRVLPAVQDLDIRFLRTRKQKFIIGDHPVVLYNQFAEHHGVLRNWGKATGLASKGLQVLMPCSPEVCVMLFDRTTYAIDGTRRVCSIGPRDVDAINRMQAINAWQCLFFDRRVTSESDLESLRNARANHPSIHGSQVREEGKLAQPDGTVGDLFRVTSPDVRIGAHLSFLRVTEQHHYRDHHVVAFPTRLPAPLLRQMLAVHSEVFAEKIATAKQKPGQSEQPMDGSDS